MKLVPVLVAGAFTSATAAGLSASLLAPPRVPSLNREQLWGDSPRHALVLGAGGILGAAWEMGVLAGLAASGVDLRSTRLVVGTSAGALVAALVRTGAPWDVLLDLARYGQATYAGVQISLPGPVRDDRVAPERVHPLDVLASPARAMAHFRWPHLAAAASGLMPPSGFSLEMLADAVNLLWDTARGPVRWPEDPTFLVAGCLRDGQRTVFGAPGEPHVSLGRAVAASCAVPGALVPVSIGQRRYVDGGVVSLTNVDLALAAGADHVWVLHPLGSPRPGRPHGLVGWGEQVVRSRQAASLDRSVRWARSRGVSVHVLRPSEEELAVFGPRFMDASRAPEVVAAALSRPLPTDTVSLWRSTTS